MQKTGSNNISAEVFAKLGNEKLLHDYCSIIFKMMGLVIDYVSAEDETLRLSSGTRFNPFCTALRKTPEGSLACSQCDIANAGKAAREKRSICYQCHAGLHEVVVPLFDDHGSYLGCMTSGQFHLNGKHLFSEKDVMALAERYHLDGKKLYDAYKSSLSVTETQLEGIIGYLSIIGRHLTGLHNKLMFLDKINTPGKIELIKQYIEENYHRRITLSETAKKHYMSQGGLAHAFKKELHVPFNCYLNSYRVSKAQEMLENTDLNIQEIAFLTGFGSVSQFNRVFRTTVGCSAKEYRKKN